MAVHLPDAVRRTVAKALLWGIGLLLVGAGPAAAQESTDACTVPPDLQPLIDLLDTLSQLAFVGGIGLATVGFSVAAILILLPGQDRSRRGKEFVQNVFIGTVLLLSADMVVSFLTSQLAGATCV